MILLECPGLVYFAILPSDWTGNWSLVMMSLMSEGHGEAGHIEGALCFLSQTHHTCTASAQHIPGQVANQYDKNLGHVTLLFLALSKELLEVVQRECC